MDTSRQRIRDIRFLMAPLCEGICRRRRLRGVSKGNTQKNHENERIDSEDRFCGFGRARRKKCRKRSPESILLDEKQSSTRRAKVRKPKSYPHSCAQMWVNSADNSWITHCFVVENSCITATSMWKTQIRRTGCGKLAHLSTSHAEFVHNFQGLMNRCSCRAQPYLSTLSTGLIMAITYSVT